MIRSELTQARAAATSLRMQVPAKSKTGASRWLLGMAGAATMGGCVTVEAPDKPIVIELNINIRQEVIYRLAEDAGRTIEENEDIF